MKRPKVQKGSGTVALSESESIDLQLKAIRKTVRFAQLPKIYQQYGIELEAATRAVYVKDVAKAWFHLERAHLLSQGSAHRHFSIHLVMFLVAVMTWSFVEALFQILKLAASVPISIFGWGPAGNLGRARSFRRRAGPIPEDLQAVFAKEKSEG